MPVTRKPKAAPARRRAKVLTFQRKDHAPMTLETKLHMPPVYALLEQNGVDWRAIPEPEFAFVADIWRRDRISRGDWRVDWQSDGEGFMMAWAQTHRWWDPEVVDRIIDEYQRRGRRRNPKDLTEAQLQTMTHEEYLDWEASTVE